MAKNIVKGDALMLFDSTGKSLGYATNHTLTISTENTEITSKDHAGHKGVVVNSIAWEIQSTNLYTVEEYEVLFSTMMAKKPVYVYFGTRKACDDDKSVANDDFNAWSVSPTANIVDSSIESYGSFSDTTASVSAADHAFYGKAFITNLSVQAPSGENATYDVTL